MDISGRTKLIPIIGDPVDGVVSPPAMNRRLSALKMDAAMVPMHVPKEALSAFCHLMRTSETFVGCSITYPHKQAAFEVADGLTDRARRLAAVNTLHRDPDGTLYGDATDGLALVHAIRKAGVALNGRTAHIIGAGGGAGRAIVDAFCSEGVGALRLEDRDDKRLKETVDLVETVWPEVALDQNAIGDILVDATAKGPSGVTASLFSDAALGAADAVCDISGSHGLSALLNRTFALQCEPIDAAQMGAGQVDAQIAFWFPNL